jgi:uncharacterized protein
MGNIRPATLRTRRTALTLVAAAAVAQTTKNSGHPVVHFEIGCRDRAKTEQFFKDLFGWPIQQNGSNIEPGRGIPGHITSLGHEPHHYTTFYVEVEDVQAYLDKATALGGKTLVPAIKTPAFTFAWISDPEGNTLGLINPQPRKSGAEGQAGQPVVHFEIGCRDRAKTAQFYADLFSWNVSQGGPVSMIDAPGGRGIPGHITALGHEPYHYTMFYVEVDDVRAYLDKATALGGKMLVPPIKTPAFTFAWFSDLEGNTIGLIKS